MLMMREAVTSQPRSADALCAWRARLGKGQPGRARQAAALQGPCRKEMKPYVEVEMLAERRPNPAVDPEPTTPGGPARIRSHKTLFNNEVFFFPFLVCCCFPPVFSSSFLVVTPGSSTSASGSAGQ